MTDPTINGLLKEAESCALAADWQGTTRILEKVLEIEPLHSGANRTIGTLLLETGEAERSIPFLKTSLQSEPGHPETTASLAKALAQTGNLSEAEQLLNRILDTSPDNRSAWNQLAQTLILQDDRVSEAVQILASLVKSDPTDRDALFMMGKVYESAEDFSSAHDLYRQILQHHPDDQRAAAALNTPHPSGISLELPSVLFLGPPIPGTQNRLGLPAKVLNEDGFPVQVGTSWQEDSAPASDVVVISQPHTNTDFIEAFLHYKTVGKRVFLDLDMHFPSMPEDHPLYDTAGPGNSDAMEVLEHMLNAADGLIVSSQALASAYQKPGRVLHIIHPAWDSDNLLWEKAADTHDEIHFGLVGSHLQPGDADIVVPVVQKLFDMNEQLRLVILGDFKLLELFEGVEETRKLFFPVGRYEDYPYQLSCIDILLVPGRDTPFNRVRSDRPLLEAGIRGIPWAASDFPSFREWKSGGVLIEDLDEWEKALSDLTQSAAERERAGLAGREKATARSVENARNIWRSILI